MRVQEFGNRKQILCIAVECLSHVLRLVLRLELFCTSLCLELRSSSYGNGAVRLDRGLGAAGTERPPLCSVRER